MLQYMGSQGVRHDLMTEQEQYDWQTFSPAFSKLPFHFVDFLCFAEACRMMISAFGRNLGK